MAHKFLDLMLTDSICRAQRDTYGRHMSLSPASARDRLTEDEAAFIATRDSFYLGTVKEDGWPYVQHRGGSPGFLHVVDPHTLAFSDYGGNRQLLSAGHLSSNKKVALFLMDYPQRTRLKILGHARLETPDSHPRLVRNLPAPERKLVERVVVIDVVGFDWNCPRHITPRYSLAEVERTVGPLKARIAELEEKLAAGDQDAETVRVLDTRERHDT